jgi:Mg2+ and Co2+ transporter CorA
MVVDAGGVRRAADADELRRQVETGRLFWLDVFGGDAPVCANLLRELGLDDADIAWALRFGQGGRIHIGRQKLRAVTWMAEPNGNLVEIHVFCSARALVTVWIGNVAALDEIRQQFAERVGGAETGYYHVAGILLQLLLGTLDHAFRGLDLEVDALRLRLDQDSSTAEFALVSRHAQKLQSVMASFNRYASAVRAAIVGIETLPGMDERGAAELNEYAEQIADVEQRLSDRRQWMSDLMHDYATAIAQRQGEQISRLTLVSMIFLPFTALTGFFGMNFNWMSSHIDSPQAFVALGVALPIASAVISVCFFHYWGLLRIRRRPHAAAIPRDAPDASAPAAPAAGAKEIANLADARMSDVAADQTRG